MQLQVVEVAVGLFAAFFLLSVLASAVVELGSMFMRKRSKDLEKVLEGMLSSDKQGAVDLASTSIWRTMALASRRKRGPGTDKRTPSYLSARSFADGVVEALVSMKSAATSMSEVVANLPAGPIRDRLLQLRDEVGDDLVAIKAGLESWFDDTMDRLEGAYKRWSQWVLLIVGIGLAAALNVSTVRGSRIQRQSGIMR